MIKSKINAGIFAKDTSEGCEQKGLVEEVVKHVYDYNLDILICPEWLFLPEGKLYSKQEKEHILDKITDMTKGEDTLIIPGTIMWHDEEFFYNTAPVISKGKLLMEHHKHSDGGTAERAKERTCDRKRYAGENYGIFEWRDYHLGVEICSDEGGLDTYMINNEMPLLDLYFLVSCGISLYQKDLPVREFGYCMQADGSDIKSKVKQKVRDYGPFDDVAPAKEVKTTKKKFFRLPYDCSHKIREEEGIKTLFNLYKLMLHK